MAAHSECILVNGSITKCCFKHHTYMYMYYSNLHYLLHGMYMCVYSICKKLTFYKMKSSSLSHLYLNVTWLFYILLNEQPVILNSSLSLLCCKVEALSGLLVIIGDPHTLAPSTCTGLQHHRITYMYMYICIRLIVKVNTLILYHCRRCTHKHITRM